MTDRDLAAVRYRCVVRRVGLGWQPQCSCGWRGPNAMTETEARTWQTRHKAADKHRGIFTGGWFQQQQWGFMSQMVGPPGTRYEFDPPNIIWPAGGQRIRVEDFDTEHPIFAIEEFSREIRRYGMRAVRLVATDA